MQDFCQAGPENTTLDVNVNRRWAPWYLFVFREQQREQSGCRYFSMDSCGYFSGFCGQCALYKV